MIVAKFNSAVTALAAHVADVLSLLDRINTSLGIWFVAVELANTLSSRPIRPHGSNFLAADKVSIYG